MKLLPLTLLLSTASSVSLAGKFKLLLYTCNKPHHGSHGSYTDKPTSGGFINETFANEVVENMPAWSDGKYTAKYSLWSRIVFVGCSNQEPSKDEAVEAIKEQEKIVGEHKDG